MYHSLDIDILECGRITKFFLGSSAYEIHFYHTEYSVCKMILKEIFSFPNMFSNPNQIANFHVNVTMLWSLAPIQANLPNWEHK